MDGVFRHADRDSLARESALSGWPPVKVLVPEKKRACLTHAPSQALACLHRNAFRHAEWRAFKRRPVNESASFVMDSSRSLREMIL